MQLGRVKGGAATRVRPAEVRERYGVDPQEVPDFIALRGDSSDRIPGAAGVGPTGAASLLRKYGRWRKLSRPEGSWLRLRSSVSIAR